MKCKKCRETKLFAVHYCFHLPLCSGWFILDFGTKELRSLIDWVKRLDKFMDVKPIKEKGK